MCRCDDGRLTAGYAGAIVQQDAVFGHVAVATLVDSAGSQFTVALSALSSTSAALHLCVFAQLPVSSGGHRQEGQGGRLLSAHQRRGPAHLRPRQLLPGERRGLA